MTPEGPNELSRALLGAGWAGVDLFFVLSGFLVSGLLFREYRERGSVDYPRFFWRRGLKIYPAFFALILIYGGMEFFLGPSFSLKGLVGEVLFIQNYYAALWNHTWSLAIEEHFYLFIGLVVLFLARTKRMDLIPAVAAFLCIGILLLRCAEVVTFGGINDFATHLRMDSLMFGVLLSYLYHQHQSRITAFVHQYGAYLLVLSLASLITLFVFPFGTAYWRTVGYTFLYVAFGAIMMVAVVARQSRFDGVLSRFIAFVGLNSYSIYLWHMAVKRGFSLLRKNEVLALNWTLELLGYVAMSVVVGVVMARVVEIPVLAIRDRKFPSRTVPVA
jgi:peptidoglycan/LPS O-acetylase OafA/YrhL